MVSFKHHKRYELAQRRLGHSVYVRFFLSNHRSHFCPVCGIGGMKNVNEWTNHVRSALHNDNYEHFMQILIAQ